MKKSDTYNETSKVYQYPQTPARMQLSLWPAGQASNAEGTIAWAGGEIDWDSEDIKDQGYYSASFGSINVECYSAPDDAATSTGKDAYVYTDTTALESDVAMTDNSTILGSMGATGLDPSLGANSSSSASASSSATDSLPTGSSGGAGNMGSGSSSSSSSSSSSDSDSSSTTSSAAGAATTTGTNSAPGQERVLQGSLFAVLVAVVALVMQ